MRRRIALWVVLCLIFVAMTGCDEYTVPVDTNLKVLHNDLATGSLELTHEVEGENFKFISQYSTPYDTSRWRVTDSKALKMKAWIEVLPGGEGVEVLVEHAHIDISLKSTQLSLNGWTCDSMDDSLHAGSQAGFWITELYPYENIFAIEGFSQTLIDGWMFLFSGYGSGSIHEKRLTEENLIEDGGVYGEKVQVVYDLLIRNSGEQAYHTRSLIDEFVIPVKMAD